MSTRAHYLKTETLISMAINTVLSIGFVFLVFHGQSRIPVLGVHGIVLDMAPQTFMVTLMGCLVPGLLTHKRLQGGALSWHVGTGKNRAILVVLTAVLAALTLTAIVVLLCWLVLPHVIPGGAKFLPLLVCKAVFGALLAAVVTRWAITRVLG